MKLFFNKEKRRLVKKIAELTAQHDKLTSELAVINRTKNPQLYSHVWCRRGDIDDKIELLKSLL